MFSKKAKKIDKIFIVDFTITPYSQIDGEDFVNLCGLIDLAVLTGPWLMNK